MHSEDFVRVCLLALVTMVCVLISACASTKATPVVALPNGFYLQANKVGKAGIVTRSGKWVLPGPVAAYAVARHTVAGALGEIPDWAASCTNDCPFKGGPESRYFILDTRTGSLESNLDETAWRKRLDDAGAPESFRIYAPYLGRSHGTGVHASAR